MRDARSWSILPPIGALALFAACTTDDPTVADGSLACEGAACATGGANSGGTFGKGGIGTAGAGGTSGRSGNGGGVGVGGSGAAGAGGGGATATGGTSGAPTDGGSGGASNSGGSGGAAGSGGNGDGGVTPPIYTLLVDAPSNQSTVRGLVTVRGHAPGFVNIEVQDGAHQNPPLARVAAAAGDGAFQTTVDTTILASGATTWTVFAWDSPPGQPFNHTANVVLSLVIGNSTGTDAGPAPKGKVVGINPQAFVSWGSLKRQNLIDSNVHSIRVPARHGSVSLIDDTVDTARANGMSVLYFAGYNPPNGDVRTSATARQLYADIALQDARKYGDVIDYIEVWNEWNGGFDLGCSWGQAGTACTDSALYTDLLCKVYDTVKPARADIKIVGGATAGVDMGFITGMLDAGAANCMDAISVHPYVFTTTAYSVPSDATASAGVDKFVEAITDVHDLVLQKSGKDMPIVISEDGRSDNGNTANYQRVADYVRELHGRAPTIPFLEGIWWYELEDEPAYQNGWGLTEANGTKKPSFTELRNAAIARR
jgi:hypothetical protein